MNLHFIDKIKRGYHGENKLMHQHFLHHSRDPLPGKYQNVRLIFTIIYMLIKNFHRRQNQCNFESISLILCHLLDGHVSISSILHFWSIRKKHFWGEKGMWIIFSFTESMSSVFPFLQQWRTRKTFRFKSGTNMSEGFWMYRRSSQTSCQKTEGQKTEGQKTERVLTLGNTNISSIFVRPWISL